MSKRAELRERLKGMSPAQREEVLKDIRARAKKNPAVSSRIPRGNHSGEAPLSSDQRRMWFLQRLHPDSVAYLVPLAVRLRGELLAEALRAALIALVERHEILRTVYPEKEGVPVQRILGPPRTLDWSFRDVASEPQPEQAARAFIDAQIGVPFAIESEPPLRVALARLGPDEHVLLLLFHHIATDEWTTGVLVGELSELYAAACDGRDSLLAPMSLQYADYATWQQKELQGEGFAKGREYWSGALAGATGRISWPIGQEAPAGVNPSERTEFQWSQELSDVLEVVAKRRGTSSFVALYACLAAFLARFSGQEDLTLGVPVSMRQRPELQNLVGMLLNTVPVRTRVARGAGFDAWLDAVQSAWRASMPHHWIPLDDIAQCVEAGAPLFDTMFTFVPDHGGAEFAIGALHATPVQVRGEVDAKCALAVSMSSRNGQFQGTFEYDAQRFERGVMVRLVEQFGTFVQRCLADPYRPIDQLELLGAAECGELRSWGRGGDVAVSAAAFPRLFERYVEEHGDRDAVRFEGGVWSYRELDQRANRLARALRREGVGQETAVGVCVQRSPNLVAALLGVMKAGGAYVALEPGLPKDRLSFMREDAGTSVVVCDAASRELWADTGVTCLEVDAATTAGDDRGLDVDFDATQLAYILYTSGTTGRPKGVMVPHRALSNICQIYAATLYGADCTPPDRCVLVKASYTFDLFVAELFPALACGAAVAIAPPTSERDPERLAAALQRLGVTDLWGTPTSFRLLLESGSKLRALGLRGLYSGGEALTTQTCREIAEAWGVAPWNLYGPTEMCCGQTGWQVDLEDGRIGVASIGGPFPNYEVGILDSQARRTSTGVDGEVVILGAGEARGYLGMARRTATSFVPAAIGERGGQRMYCAGDIGRWLPEGRIDYRGRRDDQLQVRGVRVELAEIEAHLEAAPGVAQAAVGAVAESAGRAEALAAYIVAQHPENPPAAEELHAHLGKFLAAAVIPGRFVFLDELPMMASGKVDRRALPEGEGSAHVVGRVLPRNKTEAAIARIWQKHLRLDVIGVHDNFFSVGGHSLVAVRVQRALVEHFGRAVTLATLFGNPTIAELAVVLDDVEASELAPIPRHFDIEEAPVSSDQRRMWFLQQLHPDNSAYHVPMAVRLRGRLDTEALRRATTSLVERHAILRTVYFQRDGEPFQRILPGTPDVPWGFEDVSATADPEQAARSVIANLFEAPFDLERDIPVRVSVCRLGADDHVVAFLFHHIAIDEWSTAMVVGGLAEYYAAELAGRGPQLEELSIQYADYAIWQRDQLSGPAFDEGIDFWRDHLAGAKAEVDWPMGANAVSGGSPSASIEFEWSEATSDAVRDYANLHGASKFATLYAAFGAFLTSVTGQRDVTIGLPITMRQRAELQSLVGFLLNTVPMRAQVAASASFDEWFERFQKDWQAVMEHQWIPLEEIVRSRTMNRAASSVPLFDTIFTFLPEMDEPSGLFEELETSFFALSEGAQAKVALSVSMSESGARLIGTFTYDAVRFTRANIEILLEQFGGFVEQCFLKPTIALGCLELGGARASSSDDWAYGPSVDVEAEPFPRRFERCVEAHPERVAVREGAGQWTYGELNAWSNQVALRLLELGVTPDTPVGVAVERGSELVVAIIGVLKAGGFYVALDPTLPEARLTYMMADSGVRVVLCDEAGRRAFEGRDAVVVDVEQGQQVERQPNPSVVLEPEHLAYILYTSGTTGYPKGVMTPHRALTNLVEVFGRTIFGLEEAAERTILLNASYTFDMFVGQLFPALAWGAAVSIAPPGILRQPERLPQVIVDHGVTDMVQTPTSLQVLLESEIELKQTPLKTVYSGGEALTHRVCRDIREKWEVVLWNRYGPTEMCVAQAGGIVDADGDGNAVASIGRPTSNHWVAMLNGLAVASPVGFDGEIVISGPGEARGYNAMAGRTAMSFVPRPGGLAGGRMYATGDVGRWREDSRIEYRGRRDDQVQVQGVRVELAEVEALLASSPGVAQAAVRAVGESAGRADALAAYFVAQDPDHPPSGRELHAHLEKFLASAAIPNRFVALIEMPLLPSGKVDRGALPEWDGSAAPTQRVLPRNETETAIARIWQKHLQLDVVGVHENFFEIGGHSLLAVQVRRQMVEALETEVPLNLFFRKGTIADIADYLARNSDASSVGSTTTVELRAGDETGGSPLVLVHPIGGVLFGYRAMVEALPPNQRVIGVQSPKLNGGAIPSTMKELAALYAEHLAKVLPEGRCRLVGWSFGGVVAFEMVEALGDLGIEVEHLFLLDSFAPVLFSARESAVNEFDAFAADLGATFGASEADLARFSETLNEASDEARFQVLATILATESQGSVEVDADLLSDLFVVRRAHLRAYAAYRATPLPTPATIFAACESASSSDRGWASLLDHLRRVEVATDHYGLMQMPAIDWVVSAITET